MKQTAAILAAMLLSASAMCAQAPAESQADSKGAQAQPQQPAQGAQPAPAPQGTAPQPPQQTPAPGTAQPATGAPLGKLNLNDDQKKQIHEARQDAQQQIEAVRKDTSLTPQQRHQKIREIRSAENQKIDAALTPEQREKYDAWRQAKRGHRHHARKQQP